ncbi:phospholipase [Robertkochia marina]|uniref:Phosphatidylcholine 1-acylhydrolase n=1 Tax=Robertkochia marina TaxID=1227945 RepID=A0A4S3M440_9FLAO|nr:phospholipase A [Robertkochia marina]THD69873.1 phospholipase [Robertkochia marina]TRZ46780.1 phospholipase [Robertkochia marina]
MPFRFIFPIVLWAFTCSLFGQSDSVGVRDIVTKTMEEQWQLSPSSDKGTFRITSYKPIYMLLARYSTSPNSLPFSENPDYRAVEPAAYDRVESRLQFSFKTKIFHNMFFGHGDLWVAYTQLAHWQVYNEELSRPFRELNYEPELLLNFPMKIKFGSAAIRMMGLSFNHQSNGRSLPYSRSWNRIIFHLGMESDHWQLFLRPWIRIDDADDENPKITDFVGRANATFVYSRKQHSLYSILHTDLSLGNHKGSLELNYLFPIKGTLRGHAQIFHGYGETMIDYNHRQTTFGIGLSFVDW